MGGGALPCAPYSGPPLKGKGPRPELFSEANIKTSIEAALRRLFRLSTRHQGQGLVKPLSSVLTVF